MKPYTEDEIHEFLSEYCYHDQVLEELGFEIIGRGAWKFVYGRDDCPFVVKLHGRNPYEGADEVANYNTAPAHLKPFLVPVRQGPGFQTQRRVELRECSKRGCYVEGMYDSDSGHGKWNHTHDEHGNFVIIDYGQPSQWAEPHAEETASTR